MKPKYITPQLRVPFNPHRGGADYSIISTYQTGERHDP